MNTLEQSFAKCQTVVNSCETANQYKTAQRYCGYFLNVIKRSNLPAFEAQQLELKTVQLINVCKLRSNEEN